MGVLGRSICEVIIISSLRITQYHLVEDLIIVNTSIHFFKELLENLEDILPRYYMNIDVRNNFKIFYGVLPVSKGLNIGACHD